MTIEAGALALRISEVGAEDVERKLTAIDNKAKALGNKTVQLRFTAPGIERLDNQLAQLGKQAQLFSQGAQFASTRAQSLRELGAVEKDLRSIIANGMTPLEQRIKAEQTLASLAQKQPTLLGNLQTALGKTLVAYMSWSAVTGVYNAISSAADRQEVAQMRLGATAKLTGQSLADVVAFSKRTGDQFKIGAGDAADLTQAMFKLASRAGDVSKSGALMTAWMDLAAAQGLPLSQVLAAVNSAIAGNDDGLNRLGLMDPSAIYRKWADAVGAHNGQLNDQQKMMAIVNEVMEQGAKVRGEYSKFLETTPGKQQQLNTELERTAAAFGQSIAPARIWAYEVGTAILTVIRRIHEMKDTPAFLAVLDLFGGNVGRGVARLLAPDVEEAGPRRFGPTLEQLKSGRRAPITVTTTPVTEAERKAAAEAAARQRLLGQAMAVPSGGFSLLDIGREGVGPPVVRVPVQLSLEIKGDPNFDKDLADAMREKATKLADLAMSVGNAVGGSLADGFSAAFSKDSDKNFFEAFGNSLLASLGNIVMQLGAAMLTYGLIASTFSSLLVFTPFAGITAGAGASIAAGTALIALGAGMGAIASNNSGKRTGGSGGGKDSSKTAPKDDAYSVVFDPDRKLRGRSGPAVVPSARSISNRPLPDARPVVQIGTLNALHPDDPRWQREIARTYENAQSRGLLKRGGR